MDRGAEMYLILSISIFVGAGLQCYNLAAAGEPDLSPRLWLLQARDVGWRNSVQ